MMLDRLLQIVRSWFPKPSDSTENDYRISNRLLRKRRASDLSASDLQLKHRKLSNISMSNEAFDLTNLDTFQRQLSISQSSSSSSSPSSLKRQNERSKTVAKLTSTPLDGVEIYLSGGRMGHAHRKPLTSMGGGRQNTKKTAHFASSSTPRLNANLSSLDYSIKLDDHQRYKELLRNLSSSSGASIYSTPTDGDGHLYNYDVSNLSHQQQRAKRLVSAGRNFRARKNDVIDLTHTVDESLNRRKLSTKDTVIHVLDSFEDEPLVATAAAAPIEIIDDSDSDVEILPTPVTPKPDIKVDPINSLKLIVDTNETTKQTWLKWKNDSHQNFIQRKQREVEILETKSNDFRRINRELFLKSWDRRMQVSLAVKSVILPAYEEPELPELTAEHLAIVKRALTASHSEVLTPKFKLNITRGDIQTLDGLNWLNDNVINFYMSLITERGKLDNWPTAYCMNTFFYKKLVSSGPESLRRWTRNVDIFSYEYICVPIHLGIHWCMAIVNLKQETITYYDSMGQANQKCLEALAQYLEYEHFDKKQAAFSTRDFLLKNAADIPHQMNGSDCGMFACTFAEFATRTAKFSFTQKDMPYFRKKMIVEILTEKLMIE